MKLEITKVPTNSPLYDVVHLGGLALRGEDSLIRAARHHRGEYGGLAVIENERFHQFLIWRAVLPIWHATLERERSTDLVVSRDGVRHHFELKNWRGASGNSQLKDIRKDVERLRTKDNGYILITSMNQQAKTCESIKYLLTNMPALDDGKRIIHRFETVDVHGAEIQFWIAGWPLLRDGVQS
jgi:hypothetical protein